MYIRKKLANSSQLSHILLGVLPNQFLDNVDHFLCQTIFPNEAVSDNPWLLVTIQLYLLNPALIHLYLQNDLGLFLQHRRWDTF